MSKQTRIARLSLWVVVPLCFPLALRAQSCPPAWDPQFGVPGSDFYLLTLRILDDGTGSALYAGGAFTTIGGQPANGIAKWDGQSWSSLGSGLSRVDVVEIFDDGDGPAIFAGFSSAPFLRKWNGTAWVDVGGGLDGPVVALCVHTDGDRLVLYIGGGFTRAGNVFTNGIAKWDGVAWSEVAGGVGGIFPYVLALTVFDDGNGSALYAGGLFDSAGSQNVNGIAKWDGVQWSAMGLGFNERPWRLIVFDDGNGPALYAGGNFDRDGGESQMLNHVARWYPGNPGFWSSVGGGVGGYQGATTVFDMAVFDDGRGPALYAGGFFSTAGGVPADNLAKWDGAHWSEVGGGVGGIDERVFTLTASQSDPRLGSALYIGGGFPMAGNIFSSNIAKWACPFPEGDLDCDGTLDFFDIDPFILALIDPDAYQAQYPSCFLNLADINQDGAVDFFDIDPFIALVLG